MNYKVVIFILVNLICGSLLFFGTFDANFMSLEQSWGSNPPMPINIGAMISTTVFSLMILCFANAIVLLTIGNKIFRGN